MDSESTQMNTLVADDTLTGGGEMGALIRSLDWSQTPLGPVAQWPQSLRTSVSICLASHFPMLIWWGPQLVKIYNDAYRPMIGTKHPQALGQPGRECWPEMWDIIGPMLEGVLTRDEASWSENQRLLLERNGYECYFTFSYSPIHDETGGVGGVFTVVTETTREVLGERRLRTLHDLAERTAEAKTAEEVCLIATNVLADNTADIPFALFYLLDNDRKYARLVKNLGIDANTLASPLVVDLTNAQQACQQWPLAQVASTGQVEQVDKLTERFTPLIVRSNGTTPRPTPYSALVLPISRPGQSNPYGLLVAGISPLRALDNDYRNFFELVAGQIANAIAHTVSIPLGSAHLPPDRIGTTQTRRSTALDTTRYIEEASSSLQKLAQAALTINSTLSLEEMLWLITAQARTIIGAHQAITTRTVNEQWAQSVSAVSFSDKYAEFRDYHVQPDGSGIYSLVCSTNKSMRITQDELEQHPAYRRFGKEAGKHPPLRGWLAAPLIGRDGQNLGLIQLSDKYEGDFTEEDEAILVQLAQMASVAIENAQLYSRAQEAIHGRDELLSLVSHDLKNPLSTIKGFAQLLRRHVLRGNTLNKEQIVDGLTKIDETATKMTVLINELLGLTRLQMGQPLELDRQPTDLVALVHQVVKEQQHITQKHKLLVEASEPEIVGHWDTAHLERVLANLISNAIKYSPEGGDVTIQITKDADEYARLVIQDQGMGIPASDLPHIFEQFHRASNALSGNIKGTGVGLASARQIVEQHGGAITAESTEGEGSVFTVRLPLAPPETDSF